MQKRSVRPLTPDDRGWARRILIDRWGSAEVVSRGYLHHADRLPGFVAFHQDRRVGLATYRVTGKACELVTLDSLEPHIGVGTALVRAVAQAAKNAGCLRVWLITTNDNLRALRFYQKRGFALVAVHANALETARKIKPEIPIKGLDGIPLRDEIELQTLLK